MGQVGSGQLHRGDPVIHEILQPRILQGLIHREFLAGDDPRCRFLDLTELQGAVFASSAEASPEVFGDLQRDLLATLRLAVHRREAGRGSEIGVGAMAEGVDRRDLHLRELLEGFGRAFLFK